MAAERASSLQDVSAALAVFWSLVAVVALYSVSALFGVIGGITQNSIIGECQQYLNDSTIITSNQQGLIQEDCHTATKQILIAGGIVVFVGNFIQIYFASIVNAYATRLGQHGSFQHHQLHNLDDFPETSTKTYLY
ncbi:hypothetical protein MAM1_0051c03392 [Mucor ambiguus]|uniref:Uncharacterized protein n=1 Tax=Mucor ambiguus TaxID=91626 RepID=A0A0C9M454_9FUNG|nr:hypothetical protein MAM1_0051c03392 [Mucor ambiguus]